MNEVVTYNPQTAYRTLQRLGVLINGDWAPLPAWARFLAALGAGTRATNLDRVTVAAALPTRSAAAAFVLAGIALARACESSRFHPESYFNHLCDLPAGTLVEIHDLGSKTKERGILLGKDYVSDTPYIRVQTSELNKGNRARLLPADQSFRVRILPRAGIESRRFGKRSSIEVPPLIESLMAIANAYHYVNSTSRETLIVGRRGSLARDLKSIVVAVGPDTYNVTRGTLQELVRLRLADHRPYHSHVLAPGYPKMSLIARREEPRIVIYDSASAFIRSRHHWRSSHWIVLLDRTDARFEEAAEDINGLYLARSENARLPGIPEPPSGVELTLFTR